MGWDWVERSLEWWVFNWMLDYLPLCIMGTNAKEKLNSNCQLSKEHIFKLHHLCWKLYFSSKHRASISSFIFKAIFIFKDHLNGRKSVPVRRKTWVLHLMKMETFGRYLTILSEMETQQGSALFTCHPELLH